MTSHRSITGACHELLRHSLRPGDRALDATAGNGGDTLLLASVVGSEGHVWALDCQEKALRATLTKLDAEGLSQRCTLCLGNHATIERDLPPEACRGLAAVVFNLGYLPGGGKSLTTGTASTLHALGQTWQWLRPGGCLAVVAYPGHPEGRTESAAVAEWFAGKATELQAAAERIDAGPTRRPAPFLLSLRRPGKIPAHAQ